MGENTKQFMAIIGQKLGQPSRNKIYDPEFCEQIKLLAHQGRFPDAWACEIGVSVETIRLWGHRYPEFREALIAAKQLLADYWTQEIARNRNNPDAKPAMYQMLVRRLPALFGRDPVDLTEYVLQPNGSNDTTEPPEVISAAQAKLMSTEELTTRLETLRRRRAEEQGRSDI